MSKIAVVGAGKWGKNHIRTFHELGALTAIVEVDEKQRKKCEEQWPDIKVYPSLKPVITDESITGVSVTTPAETHYTVARELLQAGKHVLVEKPITLYSSEAEELTELAAKKNRILMVGHLMLFHPAIRKIKEMIDKGELGQLQYIYSNRLNLGTVRKEENVLWSFAPHDISILNYLTDSIPNHVEAKGSTFLQPGIHDATMTQLSFPDNIDAHIYVSWLHPFKEHRLVVIGSKNMVMFEDSRLDKKLILYPKGIDWISGEPVKRDEDPVEIEFDAKMPLTEECRHFIECIEKGLKPINDGENGVQVLKVLEKAQLSMVKNGTQVSVKEAVDKDEPQIKKDCYVHPSSYIGENVEIGEGTKVWHFCHIMKNAKVGKKCIFGQNCHVANDVIIGNNVKFQNNISVYTGTTIEDDVFFGPSCVLTNVTNPRSQVNRHALYEKTLFKRGCSIGANATIVCGITIGRYAFIAAGAVVVKDVPDYALIMGVPGKQAGWVSRHGLPLKNPDKEGIMTCPESGLRYKEAEPGTLKCLDLNEEAPLPDNLNTGNVFYDDIVHSDKGRSK